MFTKINKISLVLIFFLVFFYNTNAGLVPGTIENYLNLNTSSPSIITDTNIGEKGIYDPGKSCQSGYNSYQKNGANKTGDCTKKDESCIVNVSGYCSGIPGYSSSGVLESYVSKFENNNFRILDDYRDDYCFNQGTIVDMSGNKAPTCKSVGKPGCIDSKALVCNLTDGKRAKIDDMPPDININGDEIFFNGSGAVNEWCNIAKYRGDPGYIGLYKADEHPGCEAMRKRVVPTIIGTDDLLKNLEITVTDKGEGGISGIGKVQVIIGSCNVSFSKGDKDKDGKEIVVVESSKSTPTFKINKNLLISKLSGKTRLDECLINGKNYLIVGAWDVALTNNYVWNTSNYDYKDINNFVFDDKYGNWIPSSTDPNLEPSTLLTVNNYKDSSKYVNIDYSTPKLQLIGDLSTTALSGTTTGGFTGTIIDSGTIWRNFTLKGNIEQGEIYNGGTDNECKNFSITGTGDCDNAGNVQLGHPNGTNGLIWTAPSGVDPDTGIFKQYSCDGSGKFPTIDECASACPDGKDWDGTKCVANACKATVGGVEDVIIDGQNGIVYGSGPNDCLAYCQPGHSIGCAPSPETTPPVIPPTNNCNPTKPNCSPNSCDLITGSPSSQNQAWIKSASNCGFTCTNGYSGPNCETPPAIPPTNNCNPTKPNCSPNSCDLITGSPSSQNQAWIKSASNCGFTCTNGYSGPNCETPPVGPNYCTLDATLDCDLEF